MATHYESMDSAGSESESEEMMIKDKQQDGEQASEEEGQNDVELESLGLNSAAQKVIRQPLSKGKKAYEKKKVFYSNLWRK